MSEKKTNKNPTPWLSEDSFWSSNSDAIHDIMETLRQNYPDSRVPHIAPDSQHPSPLQRKWMFTKLLGHQHGSMEGAGTKIVVPRVEEYKYWPDLNRVHYGDYYFTVPTAINSGKEYSTAFVLAGTQDENVDRLSAVQGYNPNNDNVREIVVMAGQRLRGIWEAPGEKGLEVLDVTAKYSGADIDGLRQKSPFVKEQLAKTGIGWDQPFASEYEMCRLAVEATFQKQIDWGEYPVEISIDEQADSLSYDSAEGKKTIPARREVRATYTLRDGRKVSVINGKAFIRDYGIPRPTSDSQTAETMDLISMGSREDIVIAASVPHTRAAVDALTRILAVRRAVVNTADIVTGKWLPWKELSAGLGEIPAMHRADLRLRRVLAGKSPDSPVSSVAEAVGKKLL